MNTYVVQIENSKGYAKDFRINANSFSEVEGRVIKQIAQGKFGDDLRPYVEGRNEFDGDAKSIIIEIGLE